MALQNIFFGGELIFPLCCHWKLWAIKMIGEMRGDRSSSCLHQASHPKGKGGCCFLVLFTDLCFCSFSFPLCSTCKLSLSFRSLAHTQVGIYYKIESNRDLFQKPFLISNQISEKFACTCRMLLNFALLKVAFQHC